MPVILHTKPRYTASHFTLLALLPLSTMATSCIALSLLGLPLVALACFSLSLAIALLLLMCGIFKPNTTGKPSRLATYQASHCLVVIALTFMTFFSVTDTIGLTLAAAGIALEPSILTPGIFAGALSLKALQRNFTPVRDA